MIAMVDETRNIFDEAARNAVLEVLGRVQGNLIQETRRGDGLQQRLDALRIEHDALVARMVEADEALIRERDRRAELNDERNQLARESMKKDAQIVAQKSVIEDLRLENINLKRKISDLEHEARHYRKASRWFKSLFSWGK